MSRRTAGGSLVDDDLTQILDAIFGEGGHAILTHTVDPEAAVFGEHVDRQLVQPVFVLCSAAISMRPATVRMEIRHRGSGMIIAA